jgi:hypothetical protein
MPGPSNEGVSTGPQLNPAIVQQSVNGINPYTVAQRRVEDCAFDHVSISYFRWRIASRDH